jgi:hypothetical protein
MKDFACRQTKCQYFNLHVLPLCVIISIDIRQLKRSVDAEMQVVRTYGFIEPLIISIKFDIIEASEANLKIKDHPSDLL